MSVPRAAAPAVCLAALVMAASADTCHLGPSTGQGTTAQIEFQLTGALQSGADPAVTVESVSEGQVTLTGGVSTPTPCYTFRAELSQRGDTLAVTLFATAQPVTCIQVLAAFAYHVRIYGLTSGRYTLEVAETYPGTGWAPRVEHIQVDVP